MNKSHETDLFQMISQYEAFMNEATERLSFGEYEDLYEQLVKMRTIWHLQASSDPKGYVDEALEDAQKLLEMNK